MQVVCGLSCDVSAFQNICWLSNLGHWINDRPEPYDWVRSIIFGIVSSQWPLVEAQRHRKLLFSCNLFFSRRANESEWYSFLRPSAKYKVEPLPRPFTTDYSHEESSETPFCWQFSQCWSRERGGPDFVYINDPTVIICIVCDSSLTATSKP